MFNIPQVVWSESHGTKDRHLGMGALYFTIPYLLKAKRCVCLGSGGGFVPLVMLSAQRRLIEEGILKQVDVTLVDADIGDWGRPVYKTGEEIDSELKLIKQLTYDAAPQFNNIDYLHIDANHTKEGVLSDLENYYMRLSDNWAITIHDTYNPARIEGTMPIGAWDAANEFAFDNNLSIINFRIGCGTALIMPRDNEFTKGW